MSDLEIVLTLTTIGFGGMWALSEKQISLYKKMVQLMRKEAAKNGIQL